MWLRTYSVVASRYGLKSRASPAPASVAKLRNCRDRCESRTCMRFASLSRRASTSSASLRAVADQSGRPARFSVSVVRIRREAGEPRRIGIAMSVLQPVPPDHERGWRCHFCAIFADGHVHEFELASRERHQRVPVAGPVRNALRPVCLTPSVQDCIYLP